MFFKLYTERCTSFSDFAMVTWSSAKQGVYFQIYICTYISFGICTERCKQMQDKKRAHLKA
jgi:hypothetical protein